MTPIVVLVQSPSSKYSRNLWKIFVHVLAKIGLYFYSVIRSTIQTDDLKLAKFRDQQKVNFLGVNLSMCSLKPLSLPVIPNFPETLKLHLFSRQGCYNELSVSLYS